MSRSHPPTLLTLTRRTLLDEARVGKDDRVLAAVSGGPDSMALLHALAHLRDELGYGLVAHGVDHGLRPEARAELGLAEALARSLEVPFKWTRVSVERGSNLQARARTARYAALRRASENAGATVIATGHHADDRAETVLMRLLRGSGPRGLAVLPPRAGDLVRPLIRARRSDIEAHLRRHALRFAVDPSNADPRFLRAQVRHQLMPLLERFSPSIVGHLCALADQLLAATSPLSAQSGEPLASTRGLLKKAPYMRTLARATEEALARLPLEPSRKAQVRLPGGLVATYDRTQLAVVVEKGIEWKKREFDGRHHKSHKK
jgi:tRNA(Ile)-lysidine synthase